MLEEQLTSGAIKFIMGKSYEECKNATELNDYFREERNTRCGFHNQSWSQMGNTAGRQLVQSVPENRQPDFVFFGNKCSD